MDLFPLHSHPPSYTQTYIHRHTQTHTDTHSHTHTRKTQTQTCIGRTSTQVAFSNAVASTCRMKKQPNLYTQTHTHRNTQKHTSHFNTSPNYYFSLPPRLARPPSTSSL